MQTDLEGHVLTLSFTDKDAATIARIQNSEAIKSTRFDPEFLSKAFNPSFGYGTRVHFDFLEQMVNKFSDQNIEQDGFAEQFSTHYSTTYRMVETYSEEKAPWFLAMHAAEAADAAQRAASNGVQTDPLQGEAPKTLEGITRRNRQQQNQQILKGLQTEAPSEANAATKPATALGSVQDKNQSILETLLSDDNQGLWDQWLDNQQPSEPGQNTPFKA